MQVEVKLPHATAHPELWMIADGVAKGVEVASLKSEDYGSNNRVDPKIVSNQGGKKSKSKPSAPDDTIEIHLHGEIGPRNPEADRNPDVKAETPGLTGKKSAIARVVVEANSVYADFFTITIALKEDYDTPVENEHWGEIIKRRRGCVLRRALELNAQLGRFVTSRIVNFDTNGKPTEPLASKNPLGRPNHPIGVELRMERPACYERETLFAFGEMLATLLVDLNEPFEPPAADSPFSIQHAFRGSPSAASSEDDDQADEAPPGSEASLQRKICDPDKTLDPRPYVWMDPQGLGVGLEVEFWVATRDHNTGEIAVLDRAIPKDLLEKIEEALAALPKLPYRDVQASEGQPVRLERESKPNQLELVFEPTRRPDDTLIISVLARQAVAEALKTYSKSLKAEFDYVPLFIGVAPNLKNADMISATDSRRYRESMMRYGQVQREKFISALHVHAGTFATREDRMHVIRYVRPFLPLFVAMSCGAPFALADGKLKDYASLRRRRIHALPLHGLPPHWKSADEYERWLGHKLQTNQLPDRAAIWYDIRPSAEHPTVELRALDCVADVEIEMAVAWLYLSLVHFIARRSQHRYTQMQRGDVTSVKDAINIPEFDCDIESDLISAARAGMSAWIYSPISRRHRYAHEALEELLTLVYEAAIELNCLNTLLDLRALLKRRDPSAQFRAEYSKHYLAAKAQNPNATTEALEQEALNEVLARVVSLSSAEDYAFDTESGMLTKKGGDERIAQLSQCGGQHGDTPATANEKHDDGDR